MQPSLPFSISLPKEKWTRLAFTWYKSVDYQFKVATKQARYEYILSYKTVVSNTMQQKYDGLSLLKEKSIDMKTYNCLTHEYKYKEFTGNTEQMTSLVEKETIKTGGNTYKVFNYEYDEMSNITKILRNGSLYREYTYDYLGQLTKEILNNGEVYSYIYDEKGNIKSKQKNSETAKIFDYDQYGRLKYYGSLGYSYEDTFLFNPTAYTTATSNYALSWEGRRLSQLKSSSPYHSTTYDYLYNDQGFRIYKKINHQAMYQPLTTTVYSYFYEGNKLLKETITASNVTNVTYYLYDENDLLYGFIENNQSKYFYIRDITSNIIGIIDEAGTVVVEYEYDAWGKLLSTSGPGASSVTNRFLYKGYYFDRETSLYYLNSRYYDPEIGRFISADDIDYLDPESINGLNLYAYCNNNPVF